jgi:polysaccharide biosynthesis transport protein
VDAAKQDLVDYMAILRGIWRRYKILVVGIFLGVAIPLLVVVYYTNSPMYVSTATISIEPSVFEQLPFMRELPRRDTIASHMVLLKSRSLTLAVIEALPRESFEELLTESQYTDYLLLLKNTIKSWLGKPLTVLSPQERAIAELQKARMEFTASKEAANVFIISATASKPRVAMDLVNTHIQVLLNRTRNVDQDDARRSREFLEQQYQQVKESLARNEESMTNLQQKKGRSLLGGQTELDLVRLSQLENVLAETQANRQILSARIEGLRKSLDQARSKEARVSKENSGKGDEASGASLAAENLTRVNAFKAAQDQLAKLEAKLAALREHYTEAHPLVQVTQDEVTRQQARIAQMARQLPAAPSAKEPSGSPMIPTSPSELSDAQAQLATLQRESGDLQAKEETLNLQIARLRNNLRNLSQEEVQFGNMRRSVEASRNLMTVLSDKLMAARIREQGEPGVIRIVDSASFPPQPSGSKTQQLVLMVLGLAVALAFGAAFGLEFLRQPVETESDITKATQLPVLGTVAVMKNTVAAGRGQKETHSSRPLFDPNALDRSAQASIQVELYRAIRANVETERLKAPFRSILITSPGPHEGKSTTTLNLAHVFQEFGRRVLVVEADLRRPSLPSTLALMNKPGLVDYLCGTATFEEVCRTLPSGVTVIPGQVTRKDVASLLASPYVKDLLYHANTRFDLVLVDSAPILAVPDNLLLAALLDRAILIAKATGTSIRDLRKAQTVLENSGARILGVVLNQANPRDVPYYHPRYQKYYKTIPGKPIPKGSPEIPTFPRPEKNQAASRELENEKKAL